MNEQKMKVARIVKYVSKYIYIRILG